MTRLVDKSSMKIIAMAAIKQLFVLCLLGLVIGVLTKPTYGIVFVLGGSCCLWPYLVVMPLVFYNTAASALKANVLRFFAAELIKLFLSAVSLAIIGKIFGSWLVLIGGFLVGLIGLQWLTWQLISKPKA